MKTKGIQISDKKNNLVSVELPDILVEISEGNSLNWSILYLYAVGHLDLNQSMPNFEEQIRNSNKGFLISWDDLNKLSKQFWDLIDITIIGCKDKILIKRYENDEEMYQKCDIVIEMIDSGYWQIFSRDPKLINKLLKKFKKTKIID